ncbi:MAG: hypothetical protein WBX25_26620 [Rhodomicrobium sp.]
MAAALHLLKLRTCAAAVLDINLGEETSDPVALKLIESEIPFVTLSGYASEQHPPAFKGSPALLKPLRPELLIRELRRLIELNSKKPEAGIVISA